MGNFGRNLLSKRRNFGKCLALVRIPAQSINHCCETLLEFRADLKTFQGIMVSLEKEDTLQGSTFLSDIYTWFSDKLRSKLGDSLHTQWLDMKSIFEFFW